MQTHSGNNLRCSHVAGAAQADLSVRQEAHTQEESTPERPAVRLQERLRCSRISVSAAFSDIFKELVGSGSTATLQKFLRINSDLLRQETGKC